MKNYFQKAALLLFINLVFTSNVFSQTTDSTSVSKFNNVLTNLAKELSSSTTNGLDNELHQKIYSISKVIMVITFLILMFVDIITIFKGSKKGNTDVVYFSKVTLIIILIIFSKTVTVRCSSAFNSFKSVIANTITLQDGDNSTEIALTEYRKTVNQAISDNAKNESDLIGLKESGNRIISSIYFWVIEFLLMLYNLACFIVVVFSDFLIQLMLLFLPIVLTINMLPGFEQSLLQYVKYMLSFALWPLIAGIVKLVAQKLAFAQIIGSITGISAIAQAGKLDPSAYVSVPALLVLVLMIFMVTMIPMIADMLISGSQSGGFFSSTVGKATAVSGAVAATGTALSKATPAKVATGISMGVSKLSNMINSDPVNNSSTIPTSPAATSTNTSTSSSTSVNDAIKNLTK
jgi:hypothetical protein